MLVCGLRAGNHGFTLDVIGISRGVWQPQKDHTKQRYGVGIKLPRGVAPRRCMFVWWIEYYNQYYYINGEICQGGLHPTPYGD